jgi:hypothetical protein
MAEHMTYLNECYRNKGRPSWDQYLNRFLNLPGLVDDDDMGSSNNFVVADDSQKFEISPIPMPFQTEEEIGMFVEVVSELEAQEIRLTCYNISRLFNTKIIEKLSEQITRDTFFKD